MNKSPRFYSQVRTTAKNGHQWPSMEVPLYFLKYLVETYGCCSIDNDEDGLVDEDMFDGEDNAGPSKEDYIDPLDKTDEDNDRRLNEDKMDNIDNDCDGRVDEDPCGGFSTAEFRLLIIALNWNSNPSLQITLSCIGQELLL